MAPYFLTVQGRNSDMIDTILQYLSFPFVRYTLIVSILVALCASVLGVVLVLKRFSFIGDGLSHVAFGVMAVAAVAGLTNELLIVLPVTMLAAILLLFQGQRTKIKGDAALAMISVGALAVGYLLMNLFSTSSNIAGDVCSTLFGSTNLVTLSKTDVILCSSLALVVLISFVLFYHRIFSITFDEQFSAAAGLHAKRCNLFIALLSSVVIVLAMELVGSLLISALIVFPAMSAMRIFKSYLSVTVCAACVSVFCAATGVFVSILASTPIGATIVAVNILIFLLCYLVGVVTRKA